MIFSKCLSQFRSPVKRDCTLLDMESKLPIPLRFTAIATSSERLPLKELSFVLYICCLSYGGDDFYCSH